MSDEREKTERLLARGRYWEALGLEPGTAAPKVILRIMELRDRCPNLGVELNRVQAVLTQQPQLFRQAREACDRAERRLAHAYGPAALELVGPGLWRGTWDRVTGATAPRQAEVAGELEQEARRQIEALPLLEVTTAEVRAGQMEKVAAQTNADCTQCRGTGRVTSTMTGALELARQPAQRRRMSLAGVPLELFGWIVQRQPERSGEEVSLPCPACSRTVRFALPAGIRSGWVIEGKKLDAAHPEPVLTYARLDRISQAEDPAALWASLRAELVGRHGEALFELVPEPGVREQFGLAQARGSGWQETLDWAGQVVGQLPALDLTAAEVRARVANRHVGRKDPNCRLCHGSGQVDWFQMELFLQEKKGLADIAKRLDPRTLAGLGTLPCPSCMHNVQFQVPAAALAGHVLRGKGPGAASDYFARVHSVGGSTAVPLQRAYRPVGIGGKLAAAWGMVREGYGWVLQHLFGLTPWWPERPLNVDAGLRGLTYLFLAVCLVGALLRAGTVWHAIVTLDPRLMSALIPLAFALAYATGPHKRDWIIAAVAIGAVLLLLVLLRSQIADLFRSLSGTALDGTQRGVLGIALLLLVALVLVFQWIQKRRR